MKRICQLLFSVIITSNTFSQNIGIGTTSPAGSAALDITSINKGVLVPRMSAAQRLAIPSPAKGLLVFDNKFNSYWYYSGTDWKQVGGNSFNGDSSLVIGQQTGTPPSYSLTSNPISFDSSGYLYDSGGPAGNYGNNEDRYLALLPSANQVAVDVKVLSNSLESPYDSLIISDDNNHVYGLTGTTTGTFRLYGNVTIRFKSNFANFQAGFQVRWDKIFASDNSTYDSQQLSGWYFNPEKLYMRGGVNSNNQWSPDSSGLLSFSFGEKTQAKGYTSFAAGYNSWANGTNSSVALGWQTMASGIWGSVAIGDQTKATGNSGATALGSFTLASGTKSMAMGFQSIASGNETIAIGSNIKSKSFGGFAAGIWNDSTNAASGLIINPLNRIFQIGNGTADNARSNAVTVLQNGNVGIGVTTPQAKLDLKGILAMNDSTINLRSGSGIIHGLKYLSTIDGPYLFGFNGGALGTVDLPHSLTWDYNGNVSVKTNFQSGNGIMLDTASANNGSVFNGLRFGGGNTGEAIGSKRTSTGNQFGLDFYTAFTNRLSITNSGTVQVVNNLTVQNGKGIIRSNDGTQQKKVIKDVLVNLTLAAGASTSIPFTFPETFGAAPDTYIGNVVSGAGGWAEVIMSVSNISSSGGSLYISNPRSTSWSPNFTIRIIAIGPQ